MAGGNNTQTSGQSPVPGPEIKRLEVLVGKWGTQGRTVPSPSEPAVPISGMDTYEWLGGGFFLVHHVDVLMGDERVQAIEIIGDYDVLSRTYAMRSFDNQGNVVTMRASVSDDGVWTFTDGSARATLVIGYDGNTMTARWDRSADGSNWLHWMDMNFTKVS